jgi:hypothetical protein
VENVGTVDFGADALFAVAADGDMVLTLGAGNVWQAGEKLLAKLAGLPDSQPESQPESQPPEVN